MTEVGDEVSCRVAILGGGSIGVAFAVLFAREGFDVAVYDPSMPRCRGQQPNSLDRLDSAVLGAPRAYVSPPTWPRGDGAGFVQECAPERPGAQTGSVSPCRRTDLADVPLVSSSSAIVPSALAAGLAPAVAARILVGHPGNPPYLLPVVEVVPSPATADAIGSGRLARVPAAGMRPVRVRREVEGFVFNRLQGALLREAYCLVRDGVATVDDIDEVVRSGLGRRWSFMGPFETADLNTRGGIESHAAKMGPAYERMGAERGQHDPWTPELVAQVTAQRRAILDLADWDDRVRWRDRKLTGLAAALDADRAVEIG